MSPANPSSRTPPARAGSGSGRGGWKDYWPLALGILLPLIILLILYLFGKGGLDEREARTKLGMENWQAANLRALEDEIQKYKDALNRPPCELPPRPGRGPGLALPDPLAPPLAEGEEVPSDGAPAPLTDREPAVPTAPEAGETLADVAERATVLVLVAGPGEPTQGSGFFITSNIILTNRHVVDGLRRGGGAALVTSKALGGAVEARLVSHTNPSELRDYAFLEVNPPSGSRPAVLGLTPEVKRAEHISSWGYPALIIKADLKLASLMAGDLSSVPELVYNEGVVSVVQDYEGLPLINHTADVSHGNSGGPLLNTKGEVVGINTMIRVDDLSNRQVNIALGSRDIINFAAGLGLSLGSR